MFRYALLACLWLVANAALNSKINYWLTAPEMFDDSIARVIYREFEDTNSRGLHLNVVTMQFSGANERRCSFNLTAPLELRLTMNISSFRRLTEDHIAIAYIFEEPYGHKLYTETVTLNMKNCQRKSLAQVTGIAILVPSNNNLNVFSKDDVPSCGITQCRYHYSLEKTSNKYVYRGLSRFVHELDWPSLRIENLPSLDFVVRGFQGDQYKVMRMSNSTGQFTTLMTLPTNDRKLEMFSRGLTFCWIYNPGHGKRIDCNQFNDKNELVYSTEALFDEPMTITHLHSDHEGMIGYFVAKVHCKDQSDCWLFTKKNFYSQGKGLYADGYNAYYPCPHKNRKQWFTFELHENEDQNWISVCTASGDALDLVPNCHRDSDDRLYCMGNCTKISTV